ncbi:MAG: peptidase M23 [Crocinitomicaceae bacterium]|nr:peptidase M23 [Crocinitomicaceae bacterium]|tara:strand:+ start:3415 stop:4620 length:1206 start_codon:yes stop_codon:yes gene_type:complete
MNRFFKVSLFVAVFLSLLSYTSIAQKSRKTLERERSEITKQIDYKNKLLKETRKSKSASLNQLSLLRKKIANRERLIKTLRNETKLIEEQITDKNREIQLREEELQALKEEYAKMIYHAYKTRSSYDKLMFVFASESFNQAYKRLKYLQQYSVFRKNQAAAILEAKKQLNENIVELENAKIEKEQKIKSIENEMLNLDGDRTEKQRVFNKLNSKEKELKKEIKKKQKKSKQLQRAIQKIIKEEIAKNAAKGKYGLTPEAKALSSNFENNKGKLPWPTAKGVITEYYGKHEHPELRGIYIVNNGVDISTEKGSSARAVFKGVVSGVIVLPGMGKAIMIRHGEYISVYSNLSDVFVQKGDQVELKQDLGVAITDNSKGVTEVHFELWKGQTTLNPSGWLYKFK